MRLLIIEDNERLADLLASGLSRHGYACDKAPSLEDAGLCIATVEYEAVILDLRARLQK